MNELVSVQKIKAVDVFTVNGMDPLLEAISKEVSSFIPDVSTVTTRKEIASLANKVARSKTLLDALGKELTSEWKAKAKGVDYSRKVMRNYLDDLKAKVREPLTEWEAKETERVSLINRWLADIDDLGFPEGDLTLLDLNAYLKQLDEFVVDESFGEYKEQANIKIQDSISHLQVLIEQRTQYESEQTELATLRKEKAERAESDRLKKIEDDKKAEVERIAKDKAEAVAKAKEDAAETLRIQAEEHEKNRLEAVRLKEQSEINAIEAKKQAERDKADALKEAERKAELAAKRERERIESEINRQKAEQEKREADREHARVIHTEIIDVMVLELKLTREKAQDLIIAIASKKIPHVRIQY